MGAIITAGLRPAASNSSFPHWVNHHVTVTNTGSEPLEVKVTLLGHPGSGWGAPGAPLNRNDSYTKETPIEPQLNADGARAILTTAHTTKGKRVAGQLDLYVGRELAAMLGSPSARVNSSRELDFVDAQLDAARAAGCDVNLYTSLGNGKFSTIVG